MNLSAKDADIDLKTGQIVPGPNTSAARERSIARLGGKRLVKSLPVIGFVFTLFGSSEASAEESLARAAAGEIGIGPIDLESVFDAATYLYDSGVEHRKRMKSDPEYRQRIDTMVKGAYEHAWDWTNESKW